jgi:hypothetical protein
LTEATNAALIDWLFGKADLRIGRLLVFASFFSCAFGVLTVAWGPLVRCLGWLLLPLGQNALTAYTLHLFVVAVLSKIPIWIAGEVPTTALQNTLLQGTGIIIIWTVIKLQPVVVIPGHRWIAWRKHLGVVWQKDLYTAKYSAPKGSLSV